MSRETAEDCPVLPERASSEGPRSTAAKGANLGGLPRGEVVKARRSHDETVVRQPLVALLLDPLDAPPDLCRVVVSNRAPALT